MSLRKWRATALCLIAVLVTAASLAAFAESYRGLYDWSRGHGLSGIWSDVWPLQLDAFIAVGELALFVALIDGWSRRARIGAWSVTLAGGAVSTAGNIGHVTGHDVLSRLTGGVPPLAAAGMLAVALGILKRVVEAARRGDTEPATSDDTVADTVVDKAPDNPQPVMVTTARSEPQSEGHAAGQPKRQKQGDKLARLLVTSPDLTVAEMARRAGVSERTVLRRKADARQGDNVTVPAAVSVNGNGSH